MADYDSDQLWKSLATIGMSPLLSYLNPSLNGLLAKFNKSQQPSPLVSQDAAMPNASDLSGDPAIQHALGITLPIQNPKMVPPSPEEPMPQQAPVQSPLAPDNSSQGLTNEGANLIRKLMANQQNDTYRSALLHAGAALMGPGNFGTQLGRGIEAGAGALDEGNKSAMSNAFGLAGLGVKANDTAKQAAMIRALTGQTNAANNDAAKQAALAQKALSDPLSVTMPAEQKAQLQAIVNDYVGVQIPKGNIAKATAPKTGDVINGYVFKGGDPKDKDNWESQ